MVDRDKLNPIGEVKVPRRESGPCKDASPEPGYIHAFSLLPGAETAILDRPPPARRRGSVACPASMVAEKELLHVPSAWWRPRCK
jgi:hypothetical protein